MRQATRAVLFVMAGAAAVMVWDRLAGATHGAAAPTAGLQLCATARGQLSVAGPGGCGSGTTSAGVVAHQQSANDAFAHIDALESRLAALEADNASLESRVSTLEADNASLESRVSTLEADNASLESRLDTAEGNIVDFATTFAGVTRTGSVLQFSEMNLQVVNGTGSTETSNGTGNIIIGYNRQPFDGAAERNGSHYLVVGDKHEWTSFGGIVAGIGNTASGGGASVTGGVFNTASGYGSSVSGGWGNVARGDRSSVSGGYANTASGEMSSVSGGKVNAAMGDNSSVSGGHGRSVSRPDNWRAGGLFQEY